MDDEQVLRARQVAVAASEWLHEPAEFEAYRRPVGVTAAWVAYCTPSLDELPDDDVAAHASTRCRTSRTLLARMTTAVTRTVTWYRSSDSARPPLTAR